MSQVSLTERQRKFIEIYSGNATDAARKAGYTGDANVLGKTAYDLLRNPKILAAIREREAAKLADHIAKRHHRQKFWTDVMNDPTVEISYRLRASELLGKSESDFTEKVEMNTSDSLADRLAAARKRRATTDHG